MQEGAQQVEALAMRHAMRRQQQGVAQDATRLRNQALTELNGWMRDLKAVAKVALKERPQLLEQIGVTVRA